MITKLQILTLILLMSSFKTNGFKEQQLTYPRVRKAYDEKEQNMLQLLKVKGLDREKVQIYLRAFKSEKLIELWGKNHSDSTFQLIRTYDVCRTSGKLGPKRQEGDLQIPEGFYHINKFNPYSNFYLSLGLNYPNKSDKVFGVKNNLGGDIFIHGSCVTIGCLPITDEEIKELYIFCVEARNNGKGEIPVTVFPLKPTTQAFQKLKAEYNSDVDKMGLWAELKKSYDLFNQTHQLPVITFLASGRHKVSATKEGNY